MGDVPTIEELRAAVIEVMHGQRRHLERCAAPHGLSAQVAIALLQLASPWPPQPLPGPGDASGLPMRELAGRISCDPSQVTGIADRLEDLGLAERRPSPQDRRVKLLVVTPDGARAAEELSACINRDAPGFAALTDDERRTLGTLLAKLTDASEVDASEVDASEPDATGAEVVDART